MTSKSLSQALRSGKDCDIGELSLTLSAERANHSVFRALCVSPFDAFTEREDWLKRESNALWSSCVIPLALLGLGSVCRIVGGIGFFSPSEAAAIGAARCG